MLKKMFALAMAGAALLALSVLAGGAASKTTSSSAAAADITLGFSQVGAESGWRTANTKSIQDAAKAAGIDAEVLRRPAEAGEPDQGDPLLHPAEGRRHRLLAGRRVRLGHRAQGGQGRQDPGHPHRPRGRLEGHVALQDVHRLRLRQGGQAGRRVAGQGVRGREPATVNIVELQGTTGSAPANRPQEGLRGRDRKANPKLKVIASQTGDFTRAGGKEVMEAFLKANPKIDVLFAHNDDMGLGAIEAIEAAGRSRARTSRSSPIDAVKDGMQALADGKINFIVECSPLLGPQLMDLVKKVVAGEAMPARIVTEETTFTPEQAKAALPDPQVLTAHRA